MHPSESGPRFGQNFQTRMRGSDGTDLLRNRRLLLLFIILQDVAQLVHCFHSHIQQSCLSSIQKISLLQKSRGFVVFAATDEFDGFHIYASSKVLTVNTENFDQLVLKSTTPVVVDCYAEYVPNDN